MGNNISIFDCCIIELPQINGRQGNVSPINGLINIPFEIARVFYLYDIPDGKNRGAHAHKECHQLLIAANGSFEVEVDDGNNKKTVFLNRPNLGLHVPPGIWAAENQFSTGSICLVLASHKYTETDYIRNYNDFLKLKHNDSKY